MRGHVVVIGGGTNGLAAATFLARGGCKVTLLEARPLLGGLAAGEEFHPGFSSPGLLHTGATLRDAVVRGLGLEEHGLRFAPERAVRALERDGDGIALPREASRARAALAARSAKDAGAYDAWRALLGRLRPFVSGMLSEAPPDLEPKSFGAGLDLLKTGVSLRRLGEADMLELMRIAPMAVADWTQDTFETQLLCASLCVPALSGTWLGPWSAGSAACLLAHECTSAREPIGGPAAVVRALEGAARRAGVGIETDAAVRELVLQSGAARGAVLADGRTVQADAVLSTVDPKQTLLELVPPRSLSTDLEQAILNWRARGTTAKVHLALDGPLELGADDAGQPIDRATTGESIDELERAFDAVKYGEMSERPILDIHVPSVDDPSLAPAGRHVVSILAHWVPFELRGGWNDAARATLEERVLATLESVLPGTRDRVLACETLSPADIAERYGTTGGHIHHGEHALDQLLVLRPGGDCAHYATPLEGLFLGGSGSHPGGGVTCAPGMLAARRLLDS